jgi:hypothetical protein
MAPLLDTLAADSAFAYGLGRNSGSNLPNYIFTTISGMYAYSNQFPTIVANDTSGNVYVAGISLPASTASGILVKLSSTGAFQWAQLFGGSTPVFRAVATDSSGNVYAIAAINGGDQTLVKFNTSGTLQWQRKINVSYAPGNNMAGYGITIDPTNSYIYIVSSAGGAYGTAWLFKYDISGNILNTRAIYGSNAGTRMCSVCCDPAGNIYAGGQGSQYFFSNGGPGNIWKWNSSLVFQGNTSIQWTGQASVAGSFGVQSIAADTNYVYFAGTGWNGSSFYQFGYTGKVTTALATTTSGLSIWDLSTATIPLGMGYDTLGNYAFLISNNNGPTSELIQMNSTNTVTYQYGVGSLTGYALTYDTAGTIYLNTSSSLYSNIYKLPLVGGKTGTYTNSIQSTTVTNGYNPLQIYPPSRYSASMGADVYSTWTSDNVLSNSDAAGTLTFSTITPTTVASVTIP